jgi:MFS family permease
VTAQIPTETSTAAEEIQAELDLPEEKGNPLQALTHRDFRLYWSGGFVSQLGTQMRLVAVGVQLWDLTHSYSAVGLLGLVKLIPLLGLSLFGGVVADALDRRRLMIITQSTMAITSAILAFATATGAGSALLIYAVSALSSGAVAFDNPARAALITNLVPRKHLPNALSLNIIVWQVAMVVGPLMAGLFLPMRELGFTIMYAIDAISFGAVVLALILIRTRTQVAETRNVSVGAAIEGFRFLKRAPIILSTMSLDFFATLFGAASVLIPAFAERVLHVDRELWGILYAAPAVGAVLAGIVMSWLGNVRSQGRLVLVSVAAYGLSTILFGASTYFWLTTLALAGIGASDTVSMVMRQTIRQMSTPDELRGRMTSVNMIFYMGGPQLGEFEAGFAAQLVGLGPSVMAGGLAVVALAAVVGRVVPALRNYDRA